MSHEGLWKGGSASKLLVEITEEFFVFKPQDNTNPLGLTRITLSEHLLPTLTEEWSKIVNVQVQSISSTYQSVIVITLITPIDTKLGRDSQSVRQSWAIYC
jgi:hypothetical protein